MDKIFSEIKNIEYEGRYLRMFTDRLVIIVQVFDHNYVNFLPIHPLD